jgi:hypothetical protein
MRTLSMRLKLLVSQVKIQKGEYFFSQVSKSQANIVFIIVKKQEVENITHAGSGKNVHF